MGAVPLYLKSHSRGEYVFDQGWAQAYAQHRLPYYPKLLAAIPFTPVSGPRLLAATPELKRQLALALTQLARQQNIASLHVLFPDEADQQALTDAGFMLRSNVQFHWNNHDYPCFESFLSKLTRDKRKKLRQDSRKVHAAGISFRHLNGTQICAADIEFFYTCYAQTYLSRGQTPYLSLEFFQRWFASDPQAWVLIIADRDADSLASALCIKDQDKLYGRYWGCLEYVAGLHFETCYTQAIHYCIAHRIQQFEGGAQGEHKLARGLLPVNTYSAHWIADPQFEAAIQDFLDRETPAVQEYSELLQAHSPYKQPLDEQ